MRALGRAVLLLFVAAAIVAAGVPSPLDEDRSVPGFCSPDCPLQHDGHSVAVAPAPDGHDRPAGLADGSVPTALTSVPLTLPATADPPRAPPSA